MPDENEPQEPTLATPEKQIHSSRINSEFNISFSKSAIFSTPMSCSPKRLLSLKSSTSSRQRELSELKFLTHYSPSLFLF